MWNFDLGVFRAFPVGRFRPEIRVSVTNLFNHTNWGRPVTDFTDPRFMTFTPDGGAQVNTIFGTGTVSGRSRSVCDMEF